ncbi:sugar phosphate nucleotidyltransferase [Streptomyces griseoloalbus]|uniref:NDP-sugar pyrophosphorylase family protein n=1 Tax=Streptomyces griseoloalbus TaxID=67303 RepID=A0A7W8BRB6_9ACTN|nr:sugar phosphate nucleotidyltransferase [Streptomyces albaduncus]MBB5128140.1 NDP-sugar pyrophosphorylase family protein [Streptomyces albaduncus]
MGAPVRDGRPVPGDVRGVILAAGRGTRLGSITATMPKPLVPVLNRPLIEWIAEDLAAAGISEAVCNLHYLAPAVEAWMHAAPVPGIRLTAVTEERLTGPAGGLLAVLGQLTGADQVVVVSGDACTTVDFADVVAEHRRRGAVMSVVTHVVEDPRPFGQIGVDAGGRITAMVRDPSRRLPSGLISTGMYVVSTAALDVLSDLRGTVPDLDFDRHLVPELLRRGMPVAAIGTTAYWSDVGVPQALLSSSLYLLGTARLRRSARPCQDRSSHPGADIWCQGAHPPVEGAITGRVLLGEGVSVPAGSRVEGPSVLGARTVLAQGAHVRHSITMPHTRVPAGLFDNAVLSGRADTGS